MSTTVREVGTITVETKIEIEVVKLNPDRLELRAGDQVIAAASLDDWSGKRVVDINLVSNFTNAFYVPDENEAIDALEDIGQLYLALKKGDL
ncbi:hypothetical protein AVU87_gp43 [Mycobacterium phage Theia]|uniref:Uncharacterized protein n=2 Tax=Benedictvirus TaxID=2946819 RepID=A0A0N9S0J3_9CAUD|nr:hypothetical protein AVU87_gp43 [Mycobacterium phage Theia]YP_010060849.1 hypothetical protein KIP50_gp38 [Mycobacterium phage Zolita]UVK64274.1 hypothetical protein SEA_SYDNAT_54 [Mycobacterium phage SydNat]UVK64360.1 hypothetical protein SEA_GHOULBOY_54 [Mycobacterium phage Ghoulboy]ALH46902.1 hypothetical protein SEA_THEIA_50 [Mycobacterium phage Theia]QDK03137.1 hypothetical protein SEA_ZOLITA_53 [Mycobacterium phage Zolita]